MNPLCFIDLDGVLADFVNGAFNHHGFHVPWPEIDWEFDKKSGLSPEVFYGSLDMKFWASLTRTEECDAIINAATKKFGKDNIFLCSDPGRYSCGAGAGKAIWVSNHLPDYSRRLILTNRKEVFSGPGRVLIDDRDENIKSWEVSGTGILVPRPWNATRNTSRDVSDLVVKAIERL